MARTQQKLINYHSSGNTEIDLQYLDYGEIAVRHNPENPQLIVKTGENTKATFVDSASVVTMIDNKMSSSIEDIEALKTNVSGLTDDLNSLSGEVETYKTIVDGQIEAIVSGVTQLSGYVETDCATKDALASAVTRIEATEEDVAELSGAVTSISETYATKTYVDGEIETASANVITSANGYTDTSVENALTSVAETYATKDALSSAVTRIETAEENIAELSGSVTSISETYATKTYVDNEIETASANVITSANGYTDTSVENALTSVAETYATKDALSSAVTRIEATEEDVVELSGAVTSISETYATKVYVDGEIETASANVITSANGYTDTAVENALTSVAETYATKDALSSAVTRIETAEENIEELSGSVESMSADVKTYIDNKLSVVYKFKGTKNTYEDLPAEDNVNGDVWNVISGHGTTPPGTNYAWVAESNSWDALGGSIDLSGYATVDALSSAVTRIETAEENIAELSGSVTSISETYATKTYVDGEIETASANVITSANGYTDTSVENALTSVAETYATVDALSSAVTRIETAEENIAELSGSVTSISETYATKTYVDGEIETASANVITSANGYTDTSVENALTSVAETYATKDALSSAVTRIEATEEDVAELSGAVTSISETYATKTYVDGEIETASANVITSANGYTDTSVENALTSVAETYATKDALSSATTRIETAEENIETISGHVVTIKPIAESALQGFELTGDGAVASTGNKTQQSGVVADFTSGGTATLDLSGIIIDCGNW